MYYFPCFMSFIGWSEILNFVRSIKRTANLKHLLPWFLLLFCFWLDNSFKIFFFISLFFLCSFSWKFWFCWQFWRHVEHVVQPNSASSSWKWADAKRSRRHWPHSRTYLLEESDVKIQQVGPQSLTSCCWVTTLTSAAKGQKHKNLIWPLVTLKSKENFKGRKMKNLVVTWP